MVLFTASSSSFLLGITWGGSQFPWNSWRTILPIVAGGVGLVAAFVWELYGAKRPFLRVSIMTDLSSAVAYMGTLIQGAMASQNNPQW